MEIIEVTVDTPSRSAVALFVEISGGKRDGNVIMIMDRNHYIADTIGIQPPSDEMLNCYKETSVANIVEFFNENNVKIWIDDSIEFSDRDIYVQFGLLDYICFKISNRDSLGWSAKKINIAQPIFTGDLGSTELLPVRHIQLPIIKENTQRIMALMGKRDTDIEELINCVKRDPILAARIVSIVNSSAYHNVTGPITSIDQAVIRLGFNKALHVAISLGLFGTLKLEKLSKKIMESYWQHSLLMAETASTIAKSQEVIIPPETAYLIGLLSNFGDLLLAEMYPREFDEVYCLKNINPHCNPELLEKTVTSFTASELGGWILHQWGFTVPILDAIKYQWLSEEILGLSQGAELLIATRWLLQQKGHLVSIEPQVAQKIVERYSLQSLL